MALAQVRDTSHIPDILDCLAQLSNKQVPTPPGLVRQMLDVLPADIWSDPHIRWLDPFTKSGVFLREIAVRLLDGLTDVEPVPERRRDHIFREMLFGCATSPVTELIARRTVYYSRDASGASSVVQLDRAEGNVPFVSAEHSFGANDRSCTACGAPAGAESSDATVDAYAFIHDAFPTEEMKDMKFDVIVGNPPYQIDSDGNSRTMPIYHHFVRRAIEMEPKFVLMITPSRWFAGGLGLGEFRSQMLSDRRMTELVDFRVEKDAFPGVNINGGVSYFLWDRDHAGPCGVTHIAPGGVAGTREERYLDEFDMFVRQNEAVAVLRKVREQGERTLESLVSAQKPFDLHTNFHGADTKRGLKRPVLMYESGRQSWVSRADVTRNAEWIDQWKVFLPKASDGNEVFPMPIWDIAVGPFVAGPGEICNGTYIVVAPSDSETRARRMAAYLRTRFARFLVSLRKITQDNTADRFAFVPQLPMNQVWTDEKLYARYRLTADEISFIESQIKEMDPVAPAGA